MVTVIAQQLLLVLLTTVVMSTCAAYDFYVGGRDGWTINTGEPYNHWAERMRFQVNDTLVFRYDKYADAVLLVSQSHYDACNTTDPILRLDGGDSRFVLRNSGPFFFISADCARCKAGERLIVVILAVRAPPPAPTNKPTSPSSSAAPTPRSSPSAANNVSSPSPATWIIAPMPGTSTNGTCAPSAPSTSSALAMKDRVLTVVGLLLAGGAAIVLV